MTDDEFFALSTRIEHSNITFRSLYPDEPPSDILRAHYADLTRLPPHPCTPLHKGLSTNLTFGTTALP
ncbi:MAG: hypothetical protein F4W93_10910 [Dehalococcoidia bacterium]|nr:hypothetical protein [Dehalococcoidia bacterium]